MGGHTGTSVKRAAPLSLTELSLCVRNAYGHIQSPRLDVNEAIGCAHIHIRGGVRVGFGERPHPGPHYKLNGDVAVHRTSTLIFPFCNFPCRMPDQRQLSGDDAPQGLHGTLCK